jgi:hypothetical protein
VSQKLRTQYQGTREQGRFVSQDCTVLAQIQQTTFHEVRYCQAAKKQAATVVSVGDKKILPKTRNPIPGPNGLLKRVFPQNLKNQVVFCRLLVPSIFHFQFAVATLASVYAYRYLQTSLQNNCRYSNKRWNRCDLSAQKFFQLTIQTIIFNDSEIAHESRKFRRLQTYEYPGTRVLYL